MGRKKFIERLTETERMMLEGGWKHGRSPDFRNRCQLLLLNDRGYESTQIADVLQVTPITVYNTLKAWHNQGLMGILRKKGQGRKAYLSKSNEAHVAAVQQAVEQDAQKIAVVLEDLAQQLGIQPMSKWTLKRFLKKLTLSGNASEKD